MDDYYNAIEKSYGDTAVENPFDVDSELQLLGERQKLARAETDKYKAKAASTAKLIELQQSKQATLRLRRSLLKYKRKAEQEQRLRQEAEERTVVAQADAERHRLARVQEVRKVADFLTDASPALEAAHQFHTVKEAYAKLAEENSEDCCPRCQAYPTKSVGGVRVCRACDWHEDAETDAEIPF